MAPDRGLRTRRSGDPFPNDFDPEDGIPSGDENGSEDVSADEETEDAGREHYVSVDKSALRKAKAAPLGPQYSGVRVRRNGLRDEEEDDDDPFGKGFDESDSENAAPDNISESDGESAAEGDEGDETPETDLSDDGRDGGMDNRMSFREDEVRKAMQDAPKIAASLSQAGQADVEKGRAVKKQRIAYDALLGSRMKLQKALVSVNTLNSLHHNGNGLAAEYSSAIEAAELAAFNLWSSLTDLRDRLASERTGEKRKRSSHNSSMAVADMWSCMRAQETESIERRNAILQKWSRKTQERAAAPQRSLLNDNAPQSTVLDVIQQHLADMPRLLKRARTPRSCAPLQAASRVLEDIDIYDDADFYGLMLKELLERKSADSEALSNIDISFQMRREAKAKRNVDVKASKGRKLRYTVHEKLQSFMVPEDRRTWGERQTDELFGSLFGQRLGLGEDKRDDENDSVDEGRDLLGASLMMFGN